jgi:hypothetical protein
MAKFVKLGEQASVYSDPTSNLLVIGKDVIKLNPKQETSKRVKKALSGGHLIHATEDEYKKFVKGELATEKETGKVVKKLEEMDIDELQEWVKTESGWEKVDKKKLMDITDASEALALIQKINKDYE